jgi:hypothetical protein
MFLNISPEVNTPAKGFAFTRSGLDGSPGKVDNARN